MPALLPLNNTALNITTLNNTSTELQQVICSWPLSGQYGVGSRILLVSLRELLQVETHGLTHMADITSWWPRASSLVVQNGCGMRAWRLP
jgi:hypothetical protein